MNGSDDIDPRVAVGEVSKKTIENVRKAKCRSLWAGPFHIEWKLWTGNLLLLPKWQTMTTEFWNEGPVRWFRLYWLTAAVSIYRPFAERRGATWEQYKEYARQPGAVERRGWWAEAE